MKQKEIKRVFCDDCQHYDRWSGVVIGCGHSEDCLVNPVKTVYKYDAPYYRYATPKKKNKYNNCGDFKLKTRKKK